MTRGEKGENHAHMSQGSNLKHLFLLKCVSISQFAVGWGYWGREELFPGWTSVVCSGTNQINHTWPSWGNWRHQTPFLNQMEALPWSQNNSLAPLHLSQAFQMKLKNSIFNFLKRIRSELVQTAGNHHNFSGLEQELNSRSSSSLDESAPIQELLKTNVLCCPRYYEGKGTLFCPFCLSFQTPTSDCTPAE